ncbi:outer membrane beta-barrel protein [Emticicia sp. BO119]|uniref:outer membrane beta-barrel protein n=1 Tax=Emticicia sp. BO119 TaxID=2757768 RepID=UPI0015F022E8|nr:outer membrane beta-barrel protein [Emticicia sp. BO119]MBA4850409.1 outer membrane beta-barrel protein [Emticicia sp. BO119]
MKKLFLFLLSTFFLSALTNAQTKSISGTIKDTQNEWVIGATVKLMQDSILVRGEISDGTGKFQFNNLTNGTYTLLITGISYKNYKSTNLTLDEAHSQLVLPVIILLPAKNTELKEVIIRAKKPLIEQDIDKTIVNVESMVGSANSNTVEVLEKTPGISINENGDINLNGKSNVLVLIDGRSTYMSAQDLINYLKSLPGAMLDKLELMDTPPARFDAAGGAVINIKLKKNKTLGLTGTTVLGVSKGVTFRTNEFLSLNYNRGKVNWFANGGYGRGANYYNQYNDRRYFNEGGGLISNVLLTNRNKFANNARYIRFGFDYTIGKNTTIGMLFNFMRIPRTEHNTFESQTFSQIAVLDSISSGYSDIAYDWKNRNINLNFLHKFKKSELSADANYVNYKGVGSQHFSNFMAISREAPTPTHQFMYRFLSAVSIYTFKADYSHPLKNKALFEAGIKTSFVNNDNDSRYFNDWNDMGVPDYGKSNHFIYKENINAAYVNTRKNWKRLGAQLGLRLENTQLKGNLVSNEVFTGFRFTQNFTDIFPTAFMNYKLDSLGNNTIGISYSRRISRPNYNQFNPFRTFLDNYSFSTGNPALRPYYQDRVETFLQYKQLLNLRVGYGQSNGIIMTVTEAIDNIIVSRPTNISSEKAFSASVNLTFNISKWWRTNYNFQYMYHVYDGIINNEILAIRNPKFRFNLVNQFTLSKNWSADFTFLYYSREFSEQMFVQPRFMAFGGIQKKILHNKGSIKLSFEDIFYTWKRKGNTVNVYQFQIYRTSEFDSRRIGLSFNYNFGNEKFLRKRKNNETGAEQESGRI